MLAMLSWCSQVTWLSISVLAPDRLCSIYISFAIVWGTGHVHGQNNPSQVAPSSCTVVLWLPWVQPCHSWQRYVAPWHTSPVVSSIMPRSAFLGLKVITSFPSFPLPLVFPTLMPTWASTPCPGCTICRNQAGFALLCTAARSVGSNWWWDHGTGAWGPELGDPGSTGSEGKVCARSHVIFLVEQRPQGEELSLPFQTTQPGFGANWRSFITFFFYDASLKKNHEGRVSAICLLSIYLSL